MNPSAIAIYGYFCDMWLNIMMNGVIYSYNKRRKVSL